MDTASPGRQEETLAAPGLQGQQAPPELRHNQQRRTCSALRTATLMLVENRRLMTEQSAARRLVSCAVSVASKNATGWRMSRPNSWLRRRCSRLVLSSEKSQPRMAAKPA